MKALLVNPWIYDFAAFDLWAKPLGLLYIADALRRSGCAVRLVDCMDRNFPGIPEIIDTEYGCGKYLKEETEKPAVLKHIPRRYKRYGIPVPLFEASIKGINPDVILVSSGMTYWYPGVFKAVKILKKEFPGAPVLLGGIYATLCEEHAREHSGAEVLPGGNIPEIVEKVFNLAGKKLNLFPKGSLRDNLKSLNHKFLKPAYDLYPKLDYASINTSRGCPFRCSYCASSLLSKEFIQRDPGDVIEEIVSLRDRQGIKDFVFYDDALLFKAEDHIAVILRELLKRRMGCSLHTPNGIQARYVSESIAELMRRANFIQPRLSLETSNESRQERTGAKVTNSEFAAAVNNLQKAGYRQGETGAYVMIGMPGQDLTEVKGSIKFVSGLGVKVFLSEYSPIPGTKDWQEHKFDLKDPLLHNNSIFPLYDVKDWAKFQELKDFARACNKKLVEHQAY